MDWVSSAQHWIHRKFMEVKLRMYEKGWGGAKGSFKSLRPLYLILFSHQVECAWKSKKPEANVLNERFTSIYWDINCSGDSCALRKHVMGHARVKTSKYNVNTRQLVLLTEKRKNRLPIDEPQISHLTNGSCTGGSSLQHITFFHWTLSNKVRRSATYSNNHKGSSSQLGGIRQKNTDHFTLRAIVIFIPAS